MKKYKKPSDIKVGVIGYGGAFNMGRAHLKEMELAGMTPFAVAEIDPERLKVATQDFPKIETYSTVEAMLKSSQVDLLAIITPHNTHAKLAMQCLNAGRHVVCEKPLAITTNECDAMIAAAKKNKAVLSTYHNRHWDGIVLEALSNIKDIGEVVRVDIQMSSWQKPGDWWRTSKSISGGLLYDWGVHLLEYTLQIVDSEITEVSGFLKSGIWAKESVWKSDTNEDDGFVVVRYKSGAWSTLAMSNIESKPGQFFKITGTKGSILLDWKQCEVITHQGSQTHSISTPVRKNEGWRLYQNVADHLTKGSKLIINPEWARRPIHILDLACKSSKAGKALKAKYK